MPRHAKNIAQGNAAAEHLSAGVLALCFPMPAIKSLLADCRALAQRTRDLPPEVMVFFVIAMSLFPDVGYQSVLRWLLNGLHWLGNPSFTLCVKSSLADARKRLGCAPLRRIYEHFALPLAHLGLRGSYWKKFHLVALDGSTLALQDTPENALTYGRPSNQNGDGAWPLARYVALAEVGTHLIFKAVFGSYHDSEITLSRKIISSLRPGMLCLADRLFPGFELWQEAAATGCALVWRAKVGLALTHLKTLPDGSWLAHWQPSKQERKKGRKLQPQTVRVVEYQLRDSAAAEGKKELGDVYRLLTTILDPAVADAQELAALYPQRWEIELSIKESKTVLRKGRITLRSKLPDLVEQEFWGMLLAHYAVRKMMAEAALDHHLDPDDLSYQGGVEIIKSKLAGPSLPFPPPANQGGSEKDFP
jgi:hypothetical protein